jgi:hypothetical protein
MNEHEVSSGKLFAVLVGCDYEDTARADVPPLRGAERDAKAMKRLLTKSALPNGDVRSVTLLLGKQATTAAITGSLQRVIALMEEQAHQASEDGARSTLLFYFAGHGMKGGDGLVLYTWDSEMQAADLLSILQTNPFSSAVVLDCCHAGAIGTSDGVPDDISR